MIAKLERHDVAGRKEVARMCLVLTFANPYIWHFADA